MNEGNGVYPQRGTFWESSAKLIGISSLHGKCTARSLVLLLQKGLHDFIVYLGQAYERRETFFKGMFIDRRLNASHNNPLGSRHRATWIIATAS